MILDILTHTPTWVFVLFAAIVALGACRLREGERDARRVCLVPALFVMFGVVGLSQHNDSGAVSAWLLAGALGLLIGSFCRPSMRSVDRHFQIFLAGSGWPLTRILVIFVAHYVLNVAAIMSFDHRVDFMRLDAAVSGMAAGFFAGWLWRFVQAYRVARASPAGGAGTNVVGQ